MYKLTEKQIKGVVKKAAQKLFDYCRAGALKYVVTGVSGGLDSAVVLGIAKVACDLAAEAGYDLTSVGVIMPCQSKPEAEMLGRLAIEKFDAEMIRVDLAPMFTKIEQDMMPGLDKQVQQVILKKGLKADQRDWAWSEKIAQGNIKARLRMMANYHVARMFKKAMVLSTDNLSEYWMGFWTLHGDVGDFGPIQQVLKGLELYDIAKYLEVPQGIINAKPDDGLGIAGGDEDQLGANYRTVDQVMITLIKKGFEPNGDLEQLDRLPEVEGVNVEVVGNLARRCLYNAFKRLTGGSITISRQELGLPEVQQINL